MFSLDPPRAGGPPLDGLSLLPRRHPIPLANPFRVGPLLHFDPGIGLPQKLAHREQVGLIQAVGLFPSFVALAVGPLGRGGVERASVVCVSPHDDLKGSVAELDGW